MNNNERRDIGELKWGDIIKIKLDDGKGSEQDGERPALVIQNNKGNKYSSTTIVALMTSKDKKYMPTHITCSSEDTGLPLESTILFEQIRTVDRCRIVKKMGRIRENLLKSIIKSLTITFGISYNNNVAMDFN